MDSFAHIFSYNNVGLVSGSLVALSTLGIGLQLKKILQRRKMAAQHAGIPHYATQGLLLNRFATSFMATFSMFLYGLTLVRFNHYLVWPRVLVLTLTMSIIFEIWRDRRDKASLTLLVGGIFLCLVATGLSLAGYRIAIHSTGIPYLVLAISLAFFTQGAVAQIMEIRRTKRTGALSLPMNQLFFLKDFVAIIFGYVMGAQDGWAVIVFHGFSLCSAATTMWHFRWVKTQQAQGTT